MTTPSTDPPGAAPKVALVVGAGGVGEAVIDRLRSDGMCVVAGSRSAPEQDAGGVARRRIDVTDPDSVEAAVLAACALGPLHVVVCCQGVVLSTPLADFGDAELEATLAVNLSGTAHVCRAVADRIADGGSIVTFSSVAAHRAGAGNRFAYGSSKAAVESLTRFYAVGLAPRGVRVNTIIPGPLDEPMAGTPRRQDAVPAPASSVATRVPLGRPIRVREVAEAVAFLLSSEASGITGITLPLDGGLLAK
jgi:3-oxoacyl-[acyl-carrier protein] reductase